MLSHRIDQFSPIFLKGAGTTELEPVASRVTGRLLENVNLVLVGSVLAGSVPGSILEVYLTRPLSTVGLKWILCPVVVALAGRMLWVGLAAR
jgi:uncharacterized membrane protein YfcA